MKNTLLLLIVIQSAVFLISAQTFNDISEHSGLTISTQSNGIALADYDLDGDLDVYIVAAQKYDSQDEKTWNRFYNNNGDGTFSEITEEANIRGAVLSPHDGSWGSQFGAAWGDYNNDIYPDLYLTNYGYNVLYKNNGDGTFTDISESAGVRGPINDQNSSACWWDYDLDGDLDLYVSAYIGRNIMYENSGQDTFLNITVKTGLGDRGLTWTSLPFDANNDLLPDLYVINDFGPNKFYLNKGDGTFMESTTDFGLEDDGHGMGVTLGDYNNDGYFDIYLTNISSDYPCPLFENQGNGTFIDKGEEVGISNAGWAWGTEFFDFDNDGALDLYVVNGFTDEPGKNHLFYNFLESDLVPPEERGAYFGDISDSLGVNSPLEARSLVTFDYGNDGDLDLLVGNFWSTPNLFENNTKVDNWLKINLKGTVSNRNAFGANVYISCSDKKYYRLNDGVDFLGQSILPLHFGLGNNDKIDSIVVNWPNGEQEILLNVDVNQTVTILENEGIVSGIHNKSNIVFNTEFYLLGNYPNPFNSMTNIKFHSQNKGIGAFMIFDIIGRNVFTKDLNINEGQNIIIWQGNSDKNINVASGLYFYVITNDLNKILLGKMLHLK